MEWYIIVAAIVGVLATVLGTKWVLAKRKLTEFKNIVTTLVQALEDNKLSQEEIDDIVFKIKTLLGIEKGE